jgi:GNAT superfamily N-acetyltransferase
VSTPDFAAVLESELARAVATIASAFAEDPVERWMYPGDDEYAAHFPEFVSAFGGEAMTGWRLGDFAAVAFWIPAGAEPDGEAIVNVLSATVSPDRQADTFAVLEQMDAAHPAYPHWYLPWLGVAPEMQGGGLGGELLRRCLATVDADGLPAYLETPNPRTVPFYERHGFAVTGTAQSGSCPPLTMMLRPAHPAG